MNTTSTIVVHSWNSIDVVFLCVIAISAIVGGVRGFVREVFGLVAWAASFYVSYLLLSFTTPLVASWITSPNLASIIAFVAAFVLILILTLLFAQIIANIVRETALKVVDSSLGIVVGIMRGVILLCIAYLVSLFFCPLDKYPQSLVTCKSFTWIQEGAFLLSGLLPQAVTQTAELTKKIGEIKHAEQSAEKTVEALSQLTPNALVPKQEQ